MATAYSEYYKNKSKTAAGDDDEEEDTIVPQKKSDVPLSGLTSKITSKDKMAAERRKALMRRLKGR